MPSVKSLGWNSSVDPLGKQERFDNANTFFGFQVAADFEGGRGRCWLGGLRADRRRACLTLLAVISQDSGEGGWKH